MYKIYIDKITDEGLLYYPDIPDYNLESCVVKKALNSIDTLEFTINPLNIQYSNLKEHQTKIIVYKDNNPFFLGIVMSIREILQKKRKVVCRGYLGFLMDTVLDPYTIYWNDDDEDNPKNLHTNGSVAYKGDGTSWNTDTPVHEYMRGLIYAHNKCMGLGTVDNYAWGSFRLSMNHNPETTYFYRSSTVYPYTYNEIIEKIVNNIGGFISCSYSGGFDSSNYLYYTETPKGKESGQVIRFGENLLDLEKYIDASNIVTCLIPLGAKIYDNKEGDDARLNIKSINSGKSYVTNSSAVSKYGKVFGVYRWDDVTTSYALRSKGNKKLTELINATITFSIKAIDLSNVDVNVDSIECGDSSVVVANEIGINSLSVYCTAKTTDLLNPANDLFTFGTIGTETKTSVISKNVSTANVTVSTKNGLNGEIIQRGSVNITPTADTQTSIDVKFDNVFLKAPHVVISPISTVAGTTLLGWGASGINKKGFKAWVYRTNSTVTQLHWIAIGMGTEGVNT